MDLQDLVLKPPEVDLTPYHLNVTVYRCEDLPGGGACRCWLCVCVVAPVV